MWLSQQSGCLCLSFNRTILELKFVWNNGELLRDSSFNRTILELKFQCYLSFDRQF